jgi:predicted nucleic acid-binding protein
VSFLLDTNAVSEWVKPAPDSGFIGWLQMADEGSVFLSVITLAELRLGTELLPLGARRSRLESWLQEDVIDRFEGRILIADSIVADTWGRLVARGQSQGRSISAMDGFLAATAYVHSLTVVTRNTNDFIGFCEVFNPWTK